MVNDDMKLGRKLKTYWPMHSTCWSTFKGVKRQVIAGLLWSARLVSASHTTTKEQGVESY